MMMFKEAGDHWVLPLPGARIARCSLDSAFGLEVEGNGEVTIRIEGPFSLDTPEGCVDVAAGRASDVAMNLDLSGAIIERAIAYKDGRLRLELSGSRVVVVGASADYEPWEIAGTGGLLVVSIPGGDLAIWGERR